MSAPTQRRAAGKRLREMVTPEGIALQLTLASRGSRVGALVLDLVFIALVMFAISMAAVYLGFNLAVHAGKARGISGPLQFVFITWTVAIFLARNAWFMAFELGPRGATPGKRILGIRVAARGGGRLRAEMVIARNLMREVELFVPLILLSLLGSTGDMTPGMVAALAWLLIVSGLPLWGRDRLRAGDLIGGTWVVEAPRRKLEAALTAVPAMRTANPAPRIAEQMSAGAAGPVVADHGYRFGEAEMATYGEFELQALERVLRENRPEAMLAVAEAICAKIGWSAPEGGEVPRFLSAYYTALRARLETGMRLGKRKADKFARGG